MVFQRWTTRRAREKVTRCYESDGEYVDLIVIRHHQPGAARLAAELPINPLLMPEMQPTNIQLKLN